MKKTKEGCARCDLPKGALIHATTHPSTEVREISHAFVDRQAHAWCDLGKLAPFRDLLLIAGFGLIVAGIALVNVPSALVAGGIGLILASWLMSR